MSIAEFMPYGRLLGAILGCSAPPDTGLMSKHSHDPVVLLGRMECLLLLKVNHAPHWHRPPMNTIILVEDEQTLRDLLVEFLEDSGHTVHSFETADLAWDHIQRRPHPVRLLITDLRLPGNMDGLNLVKCLRMMAPGTPVIVVSGFHQQAHTLRMDDIHWLAKPFSLQRLHELCQRIVPRG